MRPSICFCGLRCREFASAVRWARLYGLDEIDRQPGLRLRLNDRLRYVSLGGYRIHDRVSKSARIAATDASGGECVECGAAGDHVDHVARLDSGAHNHGDNLQLLCERCHLIRTWGGVPQDQEATSPSPPPSGKTRFRLVDLADEFIRRVEAVPVLKACDDKVRWQRDYLELRTRHWVGEDCWATSAADRESTIAHYLEHVDKVKAKRTRLRAAHQALPGIN